MVKGRKGKEGTKIYNDLGKTGAVRERTVEKVRSH